MTIDEALSGTLSNPATVTPPAGATDPNGDGTPDIVFDFPGSGAVGAFMMNDGHATLTPLSSTPPDGAKQA